MKQVAEGKQLLPEIGPSQNVSGTWPLTPGNHFRLELTLYQPTGSIAERKVLTWRNPQEGALTEQDEETASQLNP